MTGRKWFSVEVNATEDMWPGSLEKGDSLGIVMTGKAFGGSSKSWIGF